MCEAPPPHPSPSRYIHDTLPTPNIRASILVSECSPLLPYLPSLGADLYPHLLTLNGPLYSPLQGDFGYVGKPGPPGEDGRKVSLEAS